MNVRLNCSGQLIIKPENMIFLKNKNFLYDFWMHKINHLLNLVHVKPCGFVKYNMKCIFNELLWQALFRPGYFNSS